MMNFSSRVLIVGNRRQVNAELIPLVQRAGHIALAVETADDALEAIEHGPIPDIIISDLSDPAQRERYVERFRQLSRLGRHLVVAEGEMDIGRGGVAAGGVLSYPFEPDHVVSTLTDLVREIMGDLQSLRSDMLRETDGLRHIIKETQREVVAAMALTIETRDRFMHGHCRRVADLCLQMAGELGLSADATEKLYTAAVLHEIGRAGIPLDLLHKTEELTESEREQLAEYPRTGAMILRRISYLQSVAVLVEHHTQDYCVLPKSVAQETEDFLLTCILRVADAVDTMASERAYRPALPVSARIRTLQEGAGWRYHPIVVEAMLDVIRQRAAPESIFGRPHAQFAAA